MVVMVVDYKIKDDDKLYHGMVDEGVGGITS